jgi:serine/threonine-protein kinase HipA
LLQPALADDFSLSMAGRRNNINEETFLHFFEKAGINQVAGKNMLRRYSRIFRVWFAIIQNSFLSDDMKRRFIRIIMQRAERLEMM